ncbi:MAG: alanine--glyoxylate aminotransferase family protein [Candidatus Krumholzibacteriota bacterium]|nr:alanine--glyoxylate aminotransferase family protein [Candidatus Krumholzibacteriota bacterium]
MKEIKRILISPGPVQVSPARWENIVPVHHRGEYFRTLVKETGAGIAALAGTDASVYLMTLSGSGAMEAAIANLTRPGSKVLVVTGGKFGDRWAEIARSYHCWVELLSFAPGEAVEPEQVHSRARKIKPDFITLTHVESSSGLMIDLPGILQGLPRPRPVVILDAVASLGSEELEMEEWGIDLVVGAGQKALAAPPGISFVIAGERALRLAGENDRGLFYLSFPRYEQGREEGDTPFTPAIQSIQMVRESLRLIEDVGQSAMRKRHRESSRAFLKAALYLSLPSFPRIPSSSVQALTLPEGVNDRLLLDKLEQKTGLIATGGQGDLKGKIIRTGFLGLYGGTVLASLVEGLGASLKEMGVAVDIESAMREIDKLKGQSDIFI